jgi:neurofibromin 1
VPDAPRPEAEAYDFGNCVALHRFLYDYWDQVRQRLMSQERRDHNLRSPNEIHRGRSPVLEPLRALIANLGPPPLAVTWNRPQISVNTPLSYSRFQHFMLRNAFRGTESFVTSRAVYDGGESKVRITWYLDYIHTVANVLTTFQDGLSIICVILRHVDQDTIDYDTFLYCYLKVRTSEFLTRNWIDAGSKVCD